eukprot:TRINITY_DN43284_c0_g1_i1.p1 TRINITY_DN43284_c0_g1~~TRINITY_DN43284_c0_g1_i1.p1  ORF type:complete len:227 (+),score=62.64 TRINITY_DN43284_c0_g1_i1:33-683(+)
MSGGKMKLYNFFTSSCSFRVRIAMCYKKIDYEYVPVDILKGEQREAWFGEINPLRQVPALEVDGCVLTQSLAILEFLEERYPELPMMPRGDVERAQVRSLCEMVVSGVQPVQNLGILREIGNRFGKQHTTDWAQYWISHGFTALEQTLSKTAGTHAYGDTLTLADCCLIPQVFNATEKYGLTLDTYPTIKRVAENGFAHPAVKAAHPSAQPDAPKN